MKVPTVGVAEAVPSDVEERDGGLLVEVLERTCTPSARQTKDD